MRLFPGSVSHHHVKHTKLFKLSLSVIILGLLVLGWQKYSQSPSVGVVLQKSDTSVPAAHTANNSTKVRFKGSVIAFDYPNYYTDTQSNTGSGQTVEQFSFGAHFGPADSRRISITVKTNASPMKEDSAYTFRLQPSSGYTAETVTIGNHAVEKLSKNYSSEVAYFIPGNNYYVIAVGTSTRQQSDYLTDTSSVVTSLSWQK